MSKNYNIETHSRRNIFAGTFLGYFSIIVNILAGLIVTPWIVRSIGTSQYGVYTLVNSLVALFLIDFGLGATADTFLSKYRAENNEHKIQELLGIIYKLYLIIDVFIFVIFFILFVSINKLYTGLTIIEREQLKIAFLIVGSYSLISFPASVLNGVITSYEKFAFQKLVGIIERLLFTSLTILALVFNFGLYVLIACHAISGLISILLKYLFILKKLKIKPNLKIKLSKENSKALLFFSIWAGLAAISARLSLNATSNILGFLTNTKEIAIYGVSITIEGYVFTFGSVMAGFFLPKISRIKNQKNELFSNSLQKYGEKIGKIQFILLGLIVGGFVACGKEFLTLWMGKVNIYGPSYVGVIILVSYQLLIVPEIIFKNGLYVTSNVKFIAIPEIVSTSIIIPLCFRLGTIYGAIGACISIFIGKFVAFILNNFFYSNLLKVDILSFIKEVYAKTCLPFILSIIFCVFERKILTNHTSFSPIILFLVIGTSYVFIYAILNLFIVLNKGDRKLLFDKIINKVKKNNVETTI